MFVCRFHFHLPLSSPRGKTYLTDTRRTHVARGEQKNSELKHAKFLSSRTETRSENFACQDNF